MDIKSYQTENSPLNAPVNSEYEQDERGNKKWKGVYATALAVMMLVAYRAGYASNAVSLRTRSSLLGQNDLGLKFVTNVIDLVSPPIVEEVIRANDPADLWDSRKIVPFDFNDCPSAIPVRFDLGTIFGLSSFDMLGLTLNNGQSKCEKKGAFGFCTKGSFNGTWTIAASLESLKTRASATLVGNTSCLGEIVDNQIFCYASLNNQNLAFEASAGGTLERYILGAPTSAEITSGTLDSVDVDFGITCDKEVAAFDKKLQDFIFNGVKTFIKEKIMFSINEKIRENIPAKVPP